MDAIQQALPADVDLVELILSGNFGMLREFNEHPGFAERGPSLVVLLVRSVGADKVSSGF